MHHLQLSNTEFEGRNSVYLLGADGDGATTLVDTGVATGRIRTELESALESHDVEFVDIDNVLVTHFHYDHSGLAGAIQEAGAADVYVHEADAPLVRQDPAAIEDLEQRQEAALTEWGLPERKRAELLSFLERHEGLRGRPVDVTEVRNGDRIDVGEYEIEVLHLPGHAAGLAAYTFERAGETEAFVGDAVLPKYTPNVGGADVRVERPLASYLESLQRVIDADLSRAWPGHRGPLIDPSGRAAEIRSHHAERTARVMRVLEADSPLTAWEVSDALFGHLENIHILHGPGEASAHLDHLVHAGVVERTGEGYRPVDGAAVEAAIESLERGDIGTVR
ncbi:MAG: MBL fold metallo-hydrolase [Halodesulfurarchaeum sp.]